MRAGLALAALLLAGCSGSEQAASPQQPPTASPEPAVVTPSPLPETSRCENPEGGYSLEHPFSWSVGGGEGIEPCTFFDPAPLALTAGTEATAVAIRTDVRDVTLGHARRDTDGEQENRTANGRAAIRATGTYTDDSLLPPGTRFTTWLVALAPDRTLLLTADTASGDDYAQAVEVLDAMAQTVQPL